MTAVGFGAQVVTAKTTDQLVAEINANTSLTDKIRASNDNGKLRIENLSTTDLTVTGVAAGALERRRHHRYDRRQRRAQEPGQAVQRPARPARQARRRCLVQRHQPAARRQAEADLQRDRHLDDRHPGKDADGNATSINAGTLGITTVADADFDSDATLDSKLGSLSDALGTLRSQASGFGSNLSIVQNRQEFTKAMINTLQTGADKLVLADTNEEAANLLALQTRQQLSSTALSLASQADQAVLRLF